MKNIIFIAPPAAGKGTQSKKISNDYKIPHISTGDLLRDEVASGSVMGQFLQEEMNKGNLISDDTMVNLLRQRITKIDCNDGYILDGYPRNVSQAVIYDNLLKELGKEIGLVVYMDIDRDLALKRTLGRIVCSTCGASYNKYVSELTPSIDGICDRCGHTLKVRSDDMEETFQNRFDTYQKETTPLINYYKEKGLLKEIKVTEEKSAEAIFSMLKQMIDE